MWACERFNLYVFGCEFELEMDHRPLQHIYSVKSRLSARIERWILRLQAYQHKVVHRPGRTNIADALSRLNGTKKPSGNEYDFVRTIAEIAVPSALTAREIEEASMNDPELGVIRDCLR